MNNAKVSIIVPIYKVEKYLKKCVDSILNQTYKNIEVILVDDGSPDSCGSICDEYEKMDNRIKVIHKTNGGLSDARNYGIEEATGEFICFVDSDDYVEPAYVECMIKKAIEFDADLVVSNFQYVFENGEKKVYQFNYSNRVIDSKEAQKILLSGVESLPMIVAWSKLYSSKFFSELRFKKGIIHEDEEICHKIFHLSNKIVLVSDPLYNYLQRGDSIMGTANLKKDLITCDILKERYYFYKNNNYDMDIKDKSFYNCVELCYRYQSIAKANKDNDSYNAINEIIDSMSTNKKEIKFKVKLKLFIKKFFIKTKLITIYNKLMRKSGKNV